jgi:hypothetical protein
VVDVLVQRLGSTASEAALLRAAKTAGAADHMPVFAALAKELGKLYPAAVPSLLVGPDAPNAAAALAAMVSKCIADSADVDRQQAELQEKAAELAAVKAGTQHLIVQAAGLLKRAEQQHEACS